MTPPQRSAEARGAEFPPGTLAWDPVARSPAAEDRLVGAAFQFLTSPAGLSPERARDLGRALGHKAKADELHAFSEAFSHLGVGTLRVVQEAPDRVVFTSPDLVDAKRPKAASCALALGFVEGATQAARGGSLLGAETRCRSRGHDECMFVVMAKR